MINPGVGYTFSNDKRGTALIIDTFVPAKYTHPFRVYEDSTAEGQAILKVTPGTLNNIFPTINGTAVGETGAHFSLPSSDSIIYLTIPASQSSGAAFPAGTPTITLAGGSTIPSKTETTAYVGIAKIKATPVEGGQPVLEISPLVSGSLWGERFKCGSSSAEYWFSQI